MDYFQALWDADEELRLARTGFLWSGEGADESRLRLRKAKNAHSAIFGIAAKFALGEWIRSQQKGMSNGQKIAFANKALDALGGGKWGGRQTMEKNWNRRFWLQKVGLDAFGENLVRLYHAQGSDNVSTEVAPSSQTLANFAYRLAWLFLGGALHDNYRVISGVWRAEPKEVTQNVYKIQAREQSWSSALFNNPKRYVTAEVFRKLMQAGRIKQNGEQWAQYSKTAWSFRNPATVDADIAQAVKAADRGACANEQKTLAKAA